MSHTIHCPNELSPWPHLIFDGTKRPGVSDLHASGHSEDTVGNRCSRPDSPHLTRKPKFTRARILSASKSSSSSAQPYHRRTSFGSTQRYSTTGNDKTILSLDRKESGREVQQMLELRKRKLKGAKITGDEREVHRLRNLSVFDDIESPGSKGIRSKNEYLKVPISRNGPQTDLNLTALTKPSSSHQTHTPELCAQMQLQHALGVTIPDEFIDCNIHRTLESPTTPTRSLSPIVVQTPSSDKVSPSTTRYSPRSYRNRASSTGSPTLQGSLTFSPPKTASAASNLNEEDPFLYIGKYILNHSKDSGTTQPRKAHTTDCVCSNHSYRSNLSGQTSQHCPLCKLPNPQPEIRAVIARIEAGQSSHATIDKDIQADSQLVQSYNMEMEKRCRDGVWWEGWLVVEKLKREGIVGSVPITNDK